jgi:hypothetical protein
MVIAPGEGRPLVRRQPPVGVSTTAPAPRNPLCGGCNRPVGGHSRPGAAAIEPCRSGTTGAPGLPETKQILLVS